MHFSLRAPASLGLTLALAVLVLAGCDPKIGDSCGVSTDCSQEGTRICDTTSPGGYCTVAGCDLDTCPDGAICVQYFSVINVTKTCSEQTDCTLDEVCTVGHLCAPLSSEVRFCMTGCSSDGDCRGNYECRTLDRMAAHGGQPVRRLGQADADLSPFCAPAATCSNDDMTCDLGDTCDLVSGRCQQ
jgi:hypothetical protein